MHIMIETIAIVILASLLPTLVLAQQHHNTTASTLDGSLTISGVSGRAYHDIEGDALLSQARFRIENRGATPIKLSVLQVEFLINTGCRDLPISQQPPQLLDFRSIVTDSNGYFDHGETVIIQPKATIEVEVRLSPVSAFYSRCARHAFQVSFSAPGETLKAIAETSVVRLDRWGD